MIKKNGGATMVLPVTNHFRPQIHQHSGHQKSPNKNLANGIIQDDPGVTRSIDWYKCSRLPIDVIDLPGYGYAKGSHYGSIVADFVVKRKVMASERKICTVSIC